MKLLEGIGMISKSDRKKTVQNDQDDVIAPLPHEYDSEASPDEEKTGNTTEGVLPVIAKSVHHLNTMKVSTVK
ncbi:hypothetical protein C0995_007291 [Termitomyces sp. Mi166|nr:hypothetical protein C0995_007291 [Termitomyces sp. Mi166\